MPYDLSRIEPLALRENYLFGLGLPEGYVFGRVMRREFFTYLYNEHASIAANTWVSAAMLGISGNNVDNAFAIPIDTHRIYQIFRGIAPSPLRTYLDYPSGTPQQHLEVLSRPASADFGYVDGFESPLNCPSPKTEVWIPPKVSMGYAFFNPDAMAVTPLLKFYMWRYHVDWLKDVDLIARIMARQTECRLVTLGGLGGFDYAAKNIVGVEPVKLSDSRSDITRKVGA